MKKFSASEMQRDSQIKDAVRLKDE
jgi:hypothetical protein